MSLHQKLFLNKIIIIVRAIKFVRVALFLFFIFNIFRRSFRAFIYNIIVLVEKKVRQRN